jgi:hypothetical protein
MLTACRRKNIGYLWAIAHGATVKYDSTYDNFVIDDFVPVLPSEGDHLTYIPPETSATINIHDTSGMPDLRPRGFPLENLHDRAPTMFGFSAARPLIQQGNP